MTDREELKKLLESDLALKVKLLDFTSESVVVLDLDGNYLYANDAACAMRGYSREEMLKMNISQMAAPGYENTVKISLAELRDNGRCESEVAQLRKNGSIGLLEIHSSVINLGSTRVIMSMATDITERKRLETELKDSELRFRNLTTFSPLGIFMADINGQVQYVNARLSELTGLSPLEASGTGWVKAIHPEDKERIKALWEKAVQVTREYKVEFRFRKHDGSVCWVQVAAIPFRDGSGAVIGYIGNCVDITDLKIAEESLQSTQKELQVIFDSSPAMIFFKDKNNIIVRANKALVEVFGLPREEIEGTPLNKLFPATGEKYWLDDMEVMNTGKAKLNIIESIDTKKGLKWVRTDKIPYFGENDKVIGIIGFAVDITERKAAEDLLKDNEVRFRELFNNMSSGVVIYEAKDNGNDFIIKDCNQAVEGIEKVEKEDIIGKSVLTVFPGVRDFGLFEVFKRVWQTGRPERFPVSLYKDSRIEGWRENYVYRLPSGEVVAVYDDVSERKQSEEKLKESYAKLKKTLEGTVDALSMATETRDPYTAGHQKRVADLAYAMAVEMGLSEEERYWLRYAGLIHDIGKISVSLEILNKPGKLTEVEFTLIKMHSQVGYEIVKTIDFPKPIAEIILQHHERVNGSGYPNGITQDKMLPETKIISVADVVEAMASDRPYRAALGIDKALEEITRNKGILYDPLAVDTCLKLFREKGFQFKKY